MNKMNTCSCIYIIIFNIIINININMKLSFIIS